MRPQYLTFRLFRCTTELSCYKVCQTLLLDLELYEFHKEYYYDVQFLAASQGGIYQKSLILYKLKPNFTPI